MCRVDYVVADPNEKAAYLATLSERATAGKNTFDLCKNRGKLARGSEGIDGLWHASLGEYQFNISSHTDRYYQRQAMKASV